MLSAQNIIDFYYNFKLLIDNKLSNLDAYKFIKPISEDYLTDYKTVIIDQIVKYIERGRVESPLKEYSRSMLEDMNYIGLRDVMAKTFRSDMQRRNNVWIKLCDLLINLQKIYHNYNKVKDIYYTIDRINNNTHNNYQLVLQKFVNKDELISAFNFAHKASLTELETKVSSNLIKSHAKHTSNLLDPNLTYHEPIEESYKFNLILETSVDNMLNLDISKTKYLTIWYIMHELEYKYHMIKRSIHTTKYPDFTNKLLIKIEHKLIEICNYLRTTIIYAIEKFITTHEEYYSSDPESLAYKAQDLVSKAEKQLLRLENTDSKDIQKLIAEISASLNLMHFNGNMLDYLYRYITINLDEYTDRNKFIKYFDYLSEIKPEKEGWNKDLRHLGIKI